MPALTLGGVEFQCRDELPRWRLMELASAMKSSDPMSQMAGMHDFVLAVVKAEDRARFVSAMRALDDSGDDGVEALNQAIGSLMEQYVAAPGEGAASPRPTGRSSASPPGQTRTGGTSKVASSPPATARVVSLSPPTGRSAAS